MAYEITPIPSSDPQTDFPLSVQWQADGVDLGEPNVRVINFTASPNEFSVTRGTGEKSNVITVRKIGSAPEVPVLIYLLHFDAPIISGNPSTYDLNTTFLDEVATNAWANTTGGTSRRPCFLVPEDPKFGAACFQSYTPAIP